MHNDVPVIQVGMIEESIAREKCEKKDQEKVPGYI